MPASATHDVCRQSPWSPRGLPQGPAVGDQEPCRAGVDSANLEPVNRAVTGGAGVDGLGALVDRLVSRRSLTECSPGKLPWNDAEFSARMLREHLDQTHDRASRRAATIEAHVDWISNHLLADAPGHVADLACGPGLYTERLAELGCTCLGVDISPASVRHAQRTAVERNLDCTYVLGDIRTVDLGSGHDLAMVLFGEFNTFSPDDASQLLERVATSLRPGGTLLLEAHNFDSVVEEGTRRAGWYTSPEGLFAERPHLVLSEYAWDDSSATAKTRFIVIDDAGTLTEYTEALHAYSVDDYCDVLTATGFERATVDAGVGAFADPAMVVITAGKR